jgi:hypoxanthine phosphoribosyltransferase
LSIPFGFFNLTDKAGPHLNLLFEVYNREQEKSSIRNHMQICYHSNQFGDDVMAFQPQLKILISRDEIAEAIDRLASEIKKDYQGKQPLLIGVLKGSFVFMADLIRQLDLPLELDFVRLSSYGAARESSGRVRVVQEVKTPIKGRDVLVIEDIVDTGITTSFLLDYLRKRKPASLKLCALTDKPSRRKVPVCIDYLGLSLPNKFAVGYGLDCDERFRNLPDIYALEN